MSIKILDMDCLIKNYIKNIYDAKDWFNQSDKSAMEKMLNEGEDRRRVLFELNAWMYYFSLGKSKQHFEAQKPH